MPVKAVILSAHSGQDGSLHAAELVECRCRPSCWLSVFRRVSWPVHKGSAVFVPHTDASKPQVEEAVSLASADHMPTMAEKGMVAVPLGDSDYTCSGTWLLVVAVG